MSTNKKSLEVGSLKAIHQKNITLTNSDSSATQLHLQPRMLLDLLAKSRLNDRPKIDVPTSYKTCSFCGEMCREMEFFKLGRICLECRRARGER